MSTFPTGHALKALVRAVNERTAEDGGLYSVRRAVMALVTAHQSRRPRSLPRTAPGTERVSLPDDDELFTLSRRDGTLTRGMVPLPESHALKVRPRAGGHWATVRCLVAFPELLDVIVWCECGVFLYAPPSPRGGRRHRFCDRCARERRRAGKAEWMARARGGRKRPPPPPPPPVRVRIVWDEGDDDSLRDAR